MEPLISVIVPVYNVEKYLKYCIESIVNQTYNNLEIILVDDGSVDSSGKICDEYALKDKRIKVIHKENGGQSSARNLGLDNATGEYIAFVDSDDVISKKVYEIMYGVISDTKADVVCIKYKTVRSFDDVDINKSFDSDNYDIINSCEYIKGMCQKKYSDSVCDKLFKKELFLTYRFRCGYVNEDFLILNQIFIAENVNVVMLDYVGYFYLQHSESTTHRTVEKALLDGCDNCFKLIEKCEKENIDLKKYFVGYLLLISRSILFVLSREKINNKCDSYMLAIDNIKKYRKYILNMECKIRYKFFLVSVSFFPRITCMISRNMRLMMRWLKVHIA